MSYKTKKRGKKNGQKEKEEKRMLWMKLIIKKLDG